jgi:hypothetical protein
MDGNGGSIFSSMFGSYLLIWQKQRALCQTKKSPRQCGADVYCLSFSSALQMRNRNSLFLNEIGVQSVKTVTFAYTKNAPPAKNKSGDASASGKESSRKKNRPKLFYLQAGSVFIRHSHMLTSEKVARAGRVTDGQ